MRFRITNPYIQKPADCKSAGSGKKYISLQRFERTALMGFRRFLNTKAKKSSLLEVTR